MDRVKSKKILPFVLFSSECVIRTICVLLEFLNQVCKILQNPTLDLFSLDFWVFLVLGKERHKRRAKIHINLPIFLTEVGYEAPNRRHLVSKVLSSKLHANKVKMGPTMSGFIVITPNKISLRVFLLSG